MGMIANENCMTHIRIQWCGEIMGQCLKKRSVATTQLMMVKCTQVYPKRPIPEDGKLTTTRIDNSQALDHVVGARTRARILSRGTPREKERKKTRKREERRKEGK